MDRLVPAARPLRSPYANPKSVWPWEAAESFEWMLPTTTPGGKLLFHILGSLAEFERDLIRGRTNAGLAAARARGRNGGRPRGGNTTKKEMAIALYRDSKKPIKEICTSLNISQATLYRYVGPMKEKAEQTRT